MQHQGKNYVLKKISEWVTDCQMITQVSKKRPCWIVIAIFRTGWIMYWNTYVHSHYEHTEVITYAQSHICGYLLEKALGCELSVRS